MNCPECEMRSLGNEFKEKVMLVNESWLLAPTFKRKEKRNGRREEVSSNE